VALRPVNFDQHPRLTGVSVAGVSQSKIERMLKGAAAAGFVPSAVECHPDGRIVLCFGEAAASAESALDRELTEWKRKNAAD